MSTEAIAPRNTSLARRSDVRLVADSSRVITQLFVPGQEGFDHQGSRASPVLQRLLALSDDDIELALDDVITRFAHRHRDLLDTFRCHADELADRLDPAEKLSGSRRMLLGATFTNEYAIEGAALCNPSIVVHPDQVGVPDGSVRFVMSVRGVGEGHRSSIGFRTGLIDQMGTVALDEPAPFATTGQREAAPFDAAVFRGEIQRLRVEGENADYILDALGEEFSATELETQLERLSHQLATRQHGGRMISMIRNFAQRTYGLRFASATTLGERVLYPSMAAEAHGMEDARFVRFCEDPDNVCYLASYTAYNGVDISQQLLHTADFVSFTSSPIVGQAAANKGLALFPRKIGGRYAAMCRADRETNTITFSDNPHHWEEAAACQVPSRPWEMLQLGNCGSPIETDAGWLVLTHGVGPMRTYSIGAMLLDLDDPTKVIGQLCDPLLSPAPDDQNGYVPNVVYSCGAMVHAGTLVLPHGIADCSIGFATVAVTDLLIALTS